MAEAYIYDAVRTPRGKGKKDGSLHEITGLSLATQVLEALRDRNDLDTSRVDDVILGCVSDGPRRWPASRSTASAPPASRP